MIAFFSWYLIITLLGWLTFPLVYRLFPALADRGFSLSRTAGLLIWAYVFWLGTSLGLTENNAGGILFGLLLLVGLAYAALRMLRQASEGTTSDHTSDDTHGGIADLAAWIRQNWQVVLTVEVLFLLAFAFLAFIRAGNPELDNAEKPMELMFINSILRSASFPPHDSWLSGYAISYYYFGYVMTAMLAKLTGLTGSVAHNLMTALIFALAAIGSYGLLYDLLQARHADEVASPAAPLVRRPPIWPAFLAPLFLLLVSNLEGFLEVLHRHGIFWTGAANFWTWLGIKDLNEAPQQPLAWIPDRFWWWWRASRVVSDFDLAGNFREVIDEFPFFSFLHADLHPHVLAIPFNLLAVAIALNLFLGGWRGETTLFGLRLKISPIGFLAAALTLGGLAFLNTWDILVGMALIVLAYALLRVRLEGWSWSRLKDVVALGVPVGIAAILLYAPFYFGFSSQAGGILPNLANPTRGAQLWVMFAPLFVPVLALLVYLWRGRKLAARWKLALVLVAAAVLLLWGLSWGMAWLAQAQDPGFVQQYLGSQDSGSLGAFFAAASLRRLTYIGGLISLLVILVPAVGLLAGVRKTEALPAAPEPKKRGAKTARSRAVPAPLPQIQTPEAVLGEAAFPFILLLIVMGTLLVLTPDFVFLRDQFGSRLNTIFKFYYQAWLLWSLGAAFGIAILLQRLHGALDWVFRVVLAVLMILSLTYPVLAISNKTNGFNPPLGWTLDDFARIQHGNPDEAAAILWLRSAPDGVVAEAVGGSYSGFARISEYTGVPAVLGWPGHESQWRGTGIPQGSRQEDMKTLYNTPNWDTAQAILQRYDILYVYVGGLERSTYTVQEEKFQNNMSRVFQQGAVTIYEAP